MYAFSAFRFCNHSIHISSFITTGDLCIVLLCSHIWLNIVSKRIRNATVKELSPQAFHVLSMWSFGK